LEFFRTKPDNHQEENHSAPHRQGQSRLRRALSIKTNVHLVCSARDAESERAQGRHRQCLAEPSSNTEPATCHPPDPMNFRPGKQTPASRRWSAIAGGAFDQVTGQSMDPKSCRHRAHSRLAGTDGPKHHQMSHFQIHVLHAKASRPNISLMPPRQAARRVRKTFAPFDSLAMEQSISE